MFHSGQAFFGLEPGDIETVLLEPMFLLGYYFGMDVKTFYHFPIRYRKWLVERIATEISKATDNKADIPTKGAHHNPPQVRALAGKTKQFGINGKTWRAT